MKSSFFFKYAAGKELLAAVAALFVLFGYIGLLVGASYRWHERSDESSLASFRAKVIEDARVLSYFFSERQNDLNNLATGREMGAFFENKALGMSMEYGLRASLESINRRFKRVMEDRKLGGENIYSRIILRDARDNVLVDSAVGIEKGDINLDFEFTAAGPVQPFLHTIRGREGLVPVVATGYRFKDAYAGQLIAWISPGAPHRLLNMPNNGYRCIFIITSGHEILASGFSEVPPPESLLHALKALEPENYSFRIFETSASDGTKKKLLAGLAPVDGTPFSLLTVAEESAVLGEKTPWKNPVAMVFLALFVVAGVIAVFTVNARNLVLRARLEEASRREIEVERQVDTRTVDLKCANEKLQKEIEDRRRAEAQSKESEARMLRLVETSPIGLCIIQEKRYVYVNPAFVRNFGYDGPNEIIGVEAVNIPELMERVEGSESRFNRQVTSSPPVHYETRGTTKTGESLDMAVWITSTEYDGKSALLCFVVDVSAENKLKSQLLHSQKLEAVGRLAGGMAHDLSNLMTIVIGNADFIMNGPAECDNSEQCAGEIKEAGQRAVSLIRQILAFSRKQVLDPRIVALNEVIKGVDSMLRRMIGEDVDLEIILNPNLGMVYVDSGQIEQVIMNLALNARDAMPGGGRLSIQTENVLIKKEDADRLGDDIPPGPYVFLSVTDNGCGMDEDVLTQIFEPFFTTKESGKGTGLGLSMVYGIVKQSGGVVFCDSRPGQGSIFKIYLPCVVKETKDFDTPVVAEEPPVGGGETILVAEDDAPLRRFVSKALKTRGYTVLEAEDGEAGVFIAQNYEGEIHLFLVDVIMPKMDGVELERRISALRPRIKTIFMSGYTADRIAVHEPTLETKTFIQKPFTLEDLIQKIKAVLDVPPKRIPDLTQS